MTLSLGDDINVAVGVYVLARTATKPSAVRLYRDNNEPVRTKTRLFHTQNGSLLLPSDTKRAQVTARITFLKDRLLCVTPKLHVLASKFFSLFYKGLWK